MFISTNSPSPSGYSQGFLEIPDTSAQKFNFLPTGETSGWKFQKRILTKHGNQVLHEPVRTMDVPSPGHVWNILTLNSMNIYTGNNFILVVFSTG